MSKRTRSSDRVSTLNHEVAPDVVRLEEEIQAEEIDLALCPDPHALQTVPSPAPAPALSVAGALQETMPMATASLPELPTVDTSQHMNDAARLRAQQARIVALERQLAFARATGARAAQAAKEQYKQNQLVRRDLRDVSYTLANAHKIHDDAMARMRTELTQTRQFNERLRNEMEALTVIARRAPPLQCPMCGCALPWDAAHATVCKECNAAWDASS